MERLQGIVERITFQSEESGYTVAKLQPEGSGEEVTVVGTTLSLTAGECVALDGEWTDHARYGRQFKIESYEKVYPSTVHGMRKYLGSGLIKGIGPVMAGRIVDHFGKKTLEVIEKASKRLVEVEGLGRKRARMIEDAWKEQREIHNVMLFLQSHDVGTGHAVKIWKQYGQDSVSLIQENPYRLSRDVWGIGFATADRIAQKLGVEPHSEQRVLAGIRYVLETAAQSDGHVYLPVMELMNRCAETLEVSHELIAPCIDLLRETEEVVVEEDRIYIPSLYYAEKGVATRVHQFSSIRRVETRNIDAEIAAIEKRDGIRFASLQKVALEKALSHSLLVLTGGPGTGKTTTIRGLIALFEARDKGVLLAAPTGRAAKRMAEATGRDAKTIHRLLKFSPGELKFDMNFDNPLTCDAIIVDEVSMVDVALMNSLLQAVPLSATVVLVGDVDQLPSVGPGNVLKDIIGSGEAAVVALTEIFRQARESRIVMNAHRILAGELPELDNSRGSDFFFSQVEDPEEVAETVCGLCHDRLPRAYGVDAIDDIQVMAPMYRGETGATNLNRVLQERLNPNGQELQRGGVRFRVGDKVMQVRNNYDRDVFNGDIGRVAGIDATNQALAVRYPERTVGYEFTELDEIVPAYATSVHKSQGSEYPVVVLPLTTQHYMMLQRNLLYTAVTRARDLVVIVGTRKALAIAIKNNRVADRYTSLPQRIRAGTGDSVAPAD